VLSFRGLACHAANNLNKSQELQIAARMSKNSADDIKAAMGNIKNVRNVLIMGPMGNGKTCALDNLGALCGLVAADKIGETKFALTREDERAKGCTIKSGLNTMAIDGNLFHCLDAPGHSEYFPEMAVMAPLADGALYVVDGSKAELGPAVTQQMKLSDDFLHTPLLFCNKLDISFCTKETPIDEISDQIQTIIASFNDQVAGKTNLKDMKADPEKGQVLFGSLVNGWAFSLPSFAEIYCKKKGDTDYLGMASKIWTKYWNATTKKWAPAPTDDAIHGFTFQCLKPIKTIYDFCQSGDKDKLQKMMGALGATVTDKDFEKEKTDLFHTLMRIWMPAGPLIAKTLKDHIPDPATAQAKRFERLVDASPDDPTSQAVKKCDEKGSLLFGISKLVPMGGNAAGRFYALGRVYSGKAGADKCFMLEEGWQPKRFQEAQAQALAAEATAEPVAVDGAAGETAAEEGEADGSESPATKSPAPKTEEDKKAQSLGARIQGVVTGTAKTFNAMLSVPAGNICLLQGIDMVIQKRGTIAASETEFAMRKPTIDQSPVIKVAMQPTSAADLPKMVEGLRRLMKSDPIVETSMEDSGFHVIAACGQEHMRVLKHDMEKEYCTVGVKWEEPSITYRETVTHESSIMCLSKSPNKHNRLFIKAEPLSEELNKAIEANTINPMQDVKKRSKVLEKEFGWDKVDTLKIWGFGPAPEAAGGAYGANMLVDRTKAIQYLNEIKESVNSGLLWAARQGPLCEENMRGIRFNLYDVKLHTDSIHRGMGQIQPTARRVFFCSSLTAGIRFMEPVFMVTIAAPADVQPGIMQALGACRGEFVQTLDGITEAYVPIAETIGKTPFSTVLTQKTNGKAVSNFSFDHWEALNGDPLDFKKDKMGVWQPGAGNKAAEILLTIRKRKGLKLEPPDIAEYFDKL